MTSKKRNEGCSLHSILHRNHELILICIQGPCLWYHTNSPRTLSALLIALLTVWHLNPCNNICYNKIILFVIQKWSTNGKRVRGKQLHAHTSGSQSFAIKVENLWAIYACFVYIKYSATVISSLHLTTSNRSK